MKENISHEHCLQWRNILTLDAHESQSSRSSSIFVAVDVDANKSLQLTTSYDETALPSFQKYCSTVRVRTTLTSASTSFAKRRASLGPLTAATDPVIPSSMRGLLFIVYCLWSFAFAVVACGLWLHPYQYHTSYALYLHLHYACQIIEENTQDGY